MTYKSGFYYLTLNTYEVFKENPNTDNSNQESFESFVPTLDDLSEGYIAFATYETFDSYSTSEELSYFVLDLYPDKESAMKAGEALMEKYRKENVSRFNKDPVKNNTSPMFADGTVIDNIPCLGWGSSLKEVIIKKVDVKLEPDYVVIRPF